MKRFLNAYCRPGLSLAAGFLLLLSLVVPVHGDAASEAHTRLSNSIKYLASDKLEGRGVGTEGLNLAADFIEEQLGEAGLDVSRLENGAYQKFSMVTGSELGEPNTLEFTGPNGQTISLKRDVDFRTCSFGASGLLDAELVFCGYGIDARDEKYRDFAGIDVKGKIAMIMRRVPQQSNPHGPFGAPHGGISRHGDLRSKISNAFGNGAAAVLFVNDPYTIRQNAKQDGKLVAKASQKVVEAAEKFDAVDPANEQLLGESRAALGDAVAELKSARDEQQKPDNDPLMKFGYGGKGEGNTLPVMHITQSVCDRLLEASINKSLAKLEAEIDEELKPQSTPLTGWRAKGAATVHRTRADVKNVIGVLEGEGPLAQETIVVGAHYDHLGRGGSGSFAPDSHEVHNGADDNASGTVGLIELARRLASREEKLKRRLVFIAFTGEEMGLIGSARYVKEPLFPLNSTVAMFNMDMVGRLKDDKLTVFGIGTAPRWKSQVEEFGKRRKFTLSLKPDGFGPSDHSSFYAKKIPVLHFFTGIHSDYHRPSDDWEKVNVEGMIRVVGLLEDMIVATANQPERPKYLEVERKREQRRGGNRPYFGSIPDFSSEGPGYGISGVAGGSPAAKAGLKGSDIIVELGGQKIGGLSDFDLALRKFSAGDDVNVVVLRNGKKIKLTVTLAKPR